MTAMPTPTDPPKKKNVPPDAEQRRKLRRVGEVLSAYMDRLGWDTYRLADVTGYSTSFVRGTAHNTNWTMPSRPALRYIFDVMGADLDAPDIVEVLGYAPNRGALRGSVKRKQDAFYARKAGAPNPQPTLEVVPDPPSDAPLPLASRQEAVDAVIESLCALVNVGWSDVVGWLEANGPSLSTDQRDAVMRALWAS